MKTGGASSGLDARWMLPAIVAVGLALRMIGIEQSLRGDEFFSVYWLRKGLDYIQGPGLLVEEGNPPLYYTLLFYWTELFGTSELSVRLPTVLASVAAIPVVYRLGVTLYDMRAGLIAAALFAINPVQVFWCQLARSYGLQTLFASLCFLGIVLFLRAAQGSTGARVRGLAIYCGAAILLARTHYAQPFFVASCALVVLIACAGYGVSRAVWIRLAAEWGLANAVVLAGTLTEIPVMLQGGGYIGFFMSRMPVADMPGNLLIMLSGVARPVLACILSAFILFCGRAVWREDTGRPRLARIVLIEIPALYVTLLLLATIWHPLFVARVQVMLSIPSALLVAAFVRTISGTSARLGVLGGMACCYLAFQPFYNLPPGIRDVLATLAAEARPGDVVVFGPHDPIAALDYYQPELMSRGVYRWTADNVIPLMVEDRLWAELLPVRSLETSALAQNIADGKTVFLLLIWPKAFYTPFASRLGRPPDRIVSSPDISLYEWYGVDRAGQR